MQSRIIFLRALLKQQKEAFEGLCPKKERRYTALMQPRVGSEARMHKKILKLFKGLSTAVTYLGYPGCASPLGITNVHCNFSLSLI